MAAPTAPFSNADIERYTLYNLDGTQALDFLTFVAFDNANDGGMVRPDHANAAELAGVLEETGAPAGGSLAGDIVPTTTVPANQGGRVRRRGIAKVRTEAVACVRGTKAYVVKATGRVTNTSNSSANPEVGVFMRSTGGTANELTAVDLRFA
jgi:hypothetical protein